jgi:DNA-binding winged helix-turn-helix (wHTH) protein
MIVRFGSCEVDLGRVEIHRDSEPVPVEPQVFDVLAYLIEHRDRLVTKEELLDNVWGDRFVSESALTSRIKSARQAVGDDGKTQGVIRTAHGRGYRFVADVEIVEAATANGPGPSTPAPSWADDARTVIGGADAPVEEWPLVGRHDQLDLLRRSFGDRSCGGAIITGSAGMGKTRLAEEFAMEKEAEGAVVARMRGNADTRSIPLASIAHLLPPQVVDEVAQSGDMARAVVFLRARAALEDLAAGRRLVLVVDNATNLDELSKALVASLVGTGTFFVVLTQRTPGDDVVMFDDLVRARQLVRVDLPPLDDTELDILLYRVLEGPIDLRSLEKLTSLAQGGPGTLAELVDAALVDHVLDDSSGVWRIVGPLRPTVTVAGHAHIDVGGLDPAAVEGAELLALADDLDLDLATELLGPDALDVLDRSGLLAIATVNGRTRVSLAHHHVQLLLLDRLGPLRARRHKALLAGRLESAHVATEDRFRMVRWAIEMGQDPDRAQVLDSARHAVAIGDHDGAEILLDHLDARSPGPDLQMLRAEIAFRQGLSDTTDAILGAIPLDQLDPESAALATRRRASIMFHVHNRFEDALDLLARQHDAAPADTASILASHRVVMESIFGRAERSIAIAEAIDGPLTSGSRLEVLRGLGRARMLRGEFTAALSSFAEHQQLAAGMGDDTTAAAGWSEHVRGGILDCHAALGDLRRAAQLVREFLPYGQRTSHGMLPIAAARVELKAGRPRSARSVLNTPLAAVRVQTLRHAEPLMTALVARTHVALGEHADGLRRADEAAEWLTDLDGLPAFSLTRELAVVWLQTGRPERAADEAMRAADRAAEFGALLSEAELLSVAGASGRANEVADRLEAVTTELEGPLWALRARHVRALADGADATELERIEAGYRELGETSLADDVARRTS